MIFLIYCYCYFKEGHPFPHPSAIAADLLWRTFSQSLSAMDCFVHIRCSYDVIQYKMILHISLQWLLQNMNQGLHSQKTRHISPSRASYGVPVVRILKEINHIMSAPHCILIWISMFLIALRFDLIICQSQLRWWLCIKQENKPFSEPVLTKDPYMYH